MPNGNAPSPYTCTICGQTFNTAAELYGHRITAHPDADR